MKEGQKDALWFRTWWPSIWSFFLPRARAWVSEQTKEHSNEQCKRMNEQCKRTSKWMDKWSNTYLHADSWLIWTTVGQNSQELGPKYWAARISVRSFALDAYSFAQKVYGYLKITWICPTVECLMLCSQGTKTIKKEKHKWTLGWGTD